MKKIVYAKNGMWKFYYDLKLGICYYEPKAFTPMILFEKGMEDFDVTCTPDGDIYLMCQDDTGNLYLFRHSLHKWSKQCIFESKSVIPYNKKFTLLYANEGMNAFYTIKHGKSELLIHHLLGEENEPFVLDSCDKPIIYCVTKDNYGNIYCLYQKEEIGYKMYNSSSGLWQNFVSLHKIDNDILSIDAIVGKDGILHGVLSFRERTTYNVCYFDSVNFYEILSDIQSNPEPAIFQYDKYYILFKLGGRLIQSFSENTSKGFTKPSYYFPGSFSPNYLFKLCSSTELSDSGIIANNLYGTEIRPDKFEPAIIEKELGNN